MAWNLLHIKNMISVKVIVESMLEDPTLKEGQIGQLVLLKTDTSKRLMINGLGSTKRSVPVELKL